jgi:alkyl sulfatase BDS1-like metallo-beta-lactamase superfamily hydrolase
MAVMRQVRVWRGALACALLAACDRGGAVATSGAGTDADGFSAPTAITAQLNAKARATSGRDDPESLADARRGLIAAADTTRITSDSGQTVWSPAGFAFLADSAPASVHPSLWRHAQLDNIRGLFKVTEGVYQVRGFDLANLTLIEGKTGWIIVDALTSTETARAALAFAESKLGHKPVSAVVFTHSHVDHFGGALGVISAAEAKARKIPVVAPDGFFEEATSENVLMGNVMARRATYQFGNLLPRSPRGAVDAGIGQAVSPGKVGVLAPTLLVRETPQEVELDGVRFTFMNTPQSEAPAELMFYLPAQKAFCGAELVTRSMHNLYTLRGSKVRDALKWAGYLDDALVRFPEAEVLFSVHEWPVWGRERVASLVATQRDVYRTIHDQAVRLTNAGNTPGEVAEAVRLNPALDSNLSSRGYYGTVRHNARAIYQHYVGWFDGVPAHLDPLPPTEAAPRYVALMGGADKVVSAAQLAYDKGEYRWVAELLTQVVFAEPSHAGAKALLAQAYDQLGYQAESAVWRNFYLSGAYELRHGAPKVGIDRARLTDMLNETPVERFLEAMAGNLNGEKAADSQLAINFTFRDLNATYALKIERGVLHFRKGAADPKATATLTLTRATFVQMMIGRAGAKELFLGNDVAITGSKLDVVRFFSLFDKPSATFNIVEP